MIPKPITLMEWRIADHSSKRQVGSRYGELDEQDVKKWIEGEDEGYLEVVRRQEKKSVLREERKVYEMLKRKVKKFKHRKELIISASSSSGSTGSV